MRLIEKENLEKWASSYGSKGQLPALISKLVRATTPPSTYVHFPSGSGVYMAGWDGVVRCESEFGCVPAGVSLWELGTTDQVKKKMTDDYRNRVKDSLGHDPKQCTLVLANLNHLANKEFLRKELCNEGHWKDVKVLDVTDFVEWLDNAYAVALNFPGKLHNFPTTGIQTAEEFWEEWAIRPDFELQPKVVTAGRESHAESILQFVKGTASIKGVKASSKNEAIAFMIAAAKQFEDADREYFFSKTIIIYSAESYRSIRRNITRPLILIPAFEDLQPVFAAVSKGHHVLVPVGPDDQFNLETLDLPLNEKEGQVKALIDSGIDEEKAERLSKESGRNITILRKLLQFTFNKSEWCHPEKIREIIPAVLMGRWDEKHKGDKELLEQLSGESFDSYTEKLSRWLNYEDSPLMRFGTTWRLVSPLDAWATTSTFFVKEDFEKLEASFFKAYENGNPLIERAQDALGFFSKQTVYSTWAREGLIQSLILTGLYGENLKLPVKNSQRWVDYIINKLLVIDDNKLWVSVNNEMPLLAEASPISFLSCIRQSLKKPDPPILQMFVEDETWFSPYSHHTGLLWALESLAWLPDFLLDTTKILCKLASLDPGGKLANRPINSLTEIFKSWHHQTLADFDRRSQVLRNVAKEEKDVIWELLIRLLPKFHDVGHSTHKLRWRMFSISTKINYTYEERNAVFSFAIDLLIELFDNSEEKLAQLINESDNISPQDRMKLFEFLDDVYPNIPKYDNLGWHATRKILNYQYFIKRTLSDSDIIWYEEFYKKLEPEDGIAKLSWLFDDHYPDLPFKDDNIQQDGLKRYEVRQKVIDKMRLNALKDILAKYGLDEVLELRKKVKEPILVADTLAYVVKDEKGELRVLSTVADSESRRFAYGFIFKKTSIEGLGWLLDMYQRLKDSYSDTTLAHLFIPLNPTTRLWDFLDNTSDELQREYWKYVQPMFFGNSLDEKVRGIKYLLSNKRPIAAISAASHYPEQLPTEILVKMLKDVAEANSETNVHLDSHDVERVFEVLDQRDDASRKDLIQLEWYFMQLLNTMYARRNSKLLHQELAASPAFFVDILRWTYIPKDSEMLDAERQGVPEEVLRMRAEQSFKLLYSWKTIPGVGENGAIDNTFLKTWVTAARLLAEEAGRLDMADAEIGKVLAQYPEIGEYWPPDEIADIIEEINSDSLNRHFSIATFNKRGSSVRNAFEGGDIEREHAEYFRKLAEGHKNTHPTVAKILNDLADGYLLAADREDEEAERDRLEY